MCIIYKANEIVVLSIGKAPSQVDNDVVVRQDVVVDLRCSGRGNQKIIDRENGCCAGSALGLSLIDLIRVNPFPGNAFPRE